MKPRLNRRLPLLAGLLFAGNVVTFAASPTVSETVVGPAVRHTSVYSIGPKGGQYAVLTQKGARSVVVVNGVEGPETDGILSPRGGSAFGNRGIAFTDDGEHHAYFAKLDGGYVLVRDGQIAYKGELTPANLSYHDLKFSPGGKHVYYVDMKPVGGIGRAELIMDGKPGPGCGHQDIFPVFSRDDQKWAYSALKFGSPGWLTVVNGKEVPYHGSDLAFTGDGKLLGNLNDSDGTLTVDGKPVYKGMSISAKIGPAEVGPRWAAVMRPAKHGDPLMLCIDGKVVPGAEEPLQVIFSPDGKRYMAICQSNRRTTKYVVIDGKRGADFQAINAKAFRFTPDSSKAVYIASRQGKNVMVMEGQESEPFDTLVGQISPLVMPKQGGRFAYVTAKTGAQTLVVDGQPVAVPMPGILPDSLSFSPDGSRYAYVMPKTQAGGMRYTLFIDGKELPGQLVIDCNVAQAMYEEWNTTRGANFRYYQFSPDGKHVACFGASATDPRPGVYVDGKPVYVAMTPRAVGLPTWSPDSRHLYWIASEKVEGRPQARYRIFVDGLATSATAELNEAISVPGAWLITARGTLRALMYSGTDTKAYEVSPAAGFDIAAAMAKGVAP